MPSPALLTRLVAIGIRVKAGMVKTNVVSHFMHGGAESGAHTVLKEGHLLPKRIELSVHEDNRCKCGNFLQRF